MAKVNIIINTYNRPDRLAMLLLDIDREADHHTIKLFIYNDGSNEPYKINTKLKLKYKKFIENHGKTNYDKLVTRGFSDQKNEKFDYIIMLPDDVRLCVGFIDNAIRLFNNIIDDKKICLNLMLSKSRGGKPQWGKFQPVLRQYNGNTYWLSQWNDCCFIASKQFLKALKYKVVKSVHPNQQGSGVGRYISETLRKDYHLYQVTKSLVSHGRHASVMHYHERLKNPLIAKI